MRWRGFITESKAFVGYPGCGRLYFWTSLPAAWVRYCWAGLEYKVRCTIGRIKAWFYDEGAS